MNNGYNNYSYELKSKLANDFDNIGNIHIRIARYSYERGYYISVTLKFITGSHDELITIKENLGDAAKYYEINLKRKPRAELRISSIYIIKELLNALLPHFVKKLEHGLRALEIISLLEKFKKTDPKDLNLFLQVCALVDQYQELSNYRRRHLHTEKTVSLELKSKEFVKLK